MKLSIFCIGILLFLTNCHDDEILNEKTNSVGEIIALPYHWKKSIHVGGKRNYVGIIYGNLVFDDKIIITISDGPEQRDLTMIDVENGYELWKWNESYQPATESPKMNFPFEIQVQVLGFPSNENIGQFKDALFQFHGPASGTSLNNYNALFQSYGH